MKPGFHAVDWSAPFDVEKYVAACPETAMVKGVIIHGVLKHLETKGLPKPAGVGKFLTLQVPLFALIEQT